MKRLIYLSSLAATLLLCTITVNAQSNQSLDLTFRKMMESSESYEEYKVIKTTKLISFRNQMFDSLTEYRSNIHSLEKQLSDIQEELASLKTQFQNVESQLNATQEEADMIGFLWFEMNKMTYTIFVWSLVGLLSLFLFIMYGRIKHVCGVVKRVKSAYSKIVEDYRNQRYEATEKQIKLKRELQTALNKLEMVQSLENHQN